MRTAKGVNRYDWCEPNSLANATLARQPQLYELCLRNRCLISRFAL